jgi:hypothetical protein
LGPLGRTLSIRWQFRTKRCVKHHLLDSDDWGIYCRRSGNLPSYLLGHREEHAKRLSVMLCQAVL